MVLDRSPPDASRLGIEPQSVATRAGIQFVHAQIFSLSCLHSQWPVGRVPRLSLVLWELYVYVSSRMGRHMSLQRIEFKSHGLLQLLPGEHRVMVLEEADLVVQSCSLGPDSEDITGERGRLEATTQRLMWIEPGSRAGDPKRSCCLPIVALESANMSSGVLSHETQDPLKALHAITHVPSLL